jgi:hypothetical protein
MVSVDRRMLAPTKLTQASSGSKLNERITKRVRTVLPVVIISHCRSIIKFMICDVFPSRVYGSAFAGGARRKQNG